MEQICNPIFDITIHAFDTSSAVRLRSSPYLIPDRILSCLFRDAHHLDSLSTQLTAVWRLLLEVVAGGPASIFLTVANKTYLLSWHTRPVRAEFPHTVPKFQLFLPSWKPNRFPHLAHNFAVRQAFKYCGLSLVLAVETLLQDLYISHCLYDFFDSARTSRLSVYGRMLLQLL